MKADKHMKQTSLAIFVLLSLTIIGCEGFDAAKLEKLDIADKHIKPVTVTPKTKIAAHQLVTEMQIIERVSTGSQLPDCGIYEVSFKVPSIAGETDDSKATQIVFDKIILKKQMLAPPGEDSAKYPFTFIRHTSQDQQYSATIKMLEKEQIVMVQVYPVSEDEDSSQTLSSLYIFQRQFHGEITEGQVRPAYATNDHASILDMDIKPLQIFETLESTVIPQLRSSDSPTIIALPQSEAHRFDMEACLAFQEEIATTGTKDPSAAAVQEPSIKEFADDGLKVLGSKKPEITSTSTQPDTPEDTTYLNEPSSEEMADDGLIVFDSEKSVSESTPLPAETVMDIKDIKYLNEPSSEEMADDGLE